MSVRRLGSVCVCLLLTCMVAATVYSHTGPSDFSSVFGAVVVERDGCKDPCTDTTMKCRLECFHPSEGQPCDVDYCVLNNYHLAICEVGEPASGDPCETETDWNDWYRSGRKRDIEPEDCLNQGLDEETADECVFVHQDKTGWRTPCKTNQCYGAEDDYKTWAGRERCR